MPLILTEKDPVFGFTFLWNVTEEASFFAEHLSETSLKTEHITSWHPNRQKEWMSGRFMLHQFMSEDLSKLSVDSYGKPSFRDSLHNFSISHTEGLVGLQYHHLPIGLDLQIRTDKIQRVAHKFCTQNDYDILSEEFDRDTCELITWGLKEAVFKAYGKGNLSYLNHIILEDLIVSSTSKKVKLKLSNNADGFSYVGKIKMIGDYCISQVRLSSEKE